MKKFLNSVPIAVIGFFLTVVWLIVACFQKQDWIHLTCIFFAFMSTFTNMMSLIVRKMSLAAAKQLATISVVCSALFIVMLVIVICL